MHRAAVPEAAVDEYCEALAREDDVWPYGALRETYQVVLAKAKAASVKRGTQSDLGLGVALSVRSHPERDLLARWVRVGQLLHRPHEQSTVALARDAMSSLDATITSGRGSFAVRRTAPLAQR
jgi:hypothetical protein